MREPPKVSRGSGRGGALNSSYFLAVYALLNRDTFGSGFETPKSGAVQQVQQEDRGRSGGDFGGDFY